MLRIVLKPSGLLALSLGLGALAVLAVRNGRQEVAAAEPPHSPATTLAAAVAADAVADTSAASTSAHGHAIYRDKAENGWDAAGWTWAKNVDFADHATVYAGTSAIRVSFDNFDGVKFHHLPLNTAPFDRISFVVNGGPKGGQVIQIGAACSEKNVAEGVRIAPLPPNRWVSVTVPLRDVGLANRPDMTSFWIQGASAGVQAPLDIDDVRLLKPDEPAPTAPALARQKA